MENEVDSQKPQEEQEEREERFHKTIFPRELTLVLSGLHMLHSESYLDNNMPLSREIMSLIDELKQGAKWNETDEKGLIL